MQIVIEGEAAAILERRVQLGRLAPPRKAVEDALRRADRKRQRKLTWIRARVQEAPDKGGEWTMEEVERGLEAMLPRVEKDLT